MPVKAYFGGHGKEVMASMKKKHGKRAEEVFYKTVNKKHQRPEDKMPKVAKMSPSGDIGKYRQEESVKAGGFKDGKTVSAAKELPNK